MTSLGPQKRWALLRRSTPEILNWLGRVAAEEEAALYLVGGIVRDEILRRKTLDVDLACEGNVKRLGSRLAKEMGTKFTFYQPFMTGTLEGPGGARIDLAQTRSETYPVQGRLPEVKPASIEDDLYRRDFTINAIARSLVPGHFGKLIDPLSGRKDIHKGVIKIIHDQSFRDDPTRIFRAVRYSERFGFRIEPKTFKLLKEAVNKIPHLSGERLLYELRCIAREPGEVRVRTVKRLEKLGTLGFLGRPLEPLSPTRFSLIPDDEPCEFLCFLLSLFDTKQVRKLPLNKACLETVRTLRMLKVIIAKLRNLKTPSKILFCLEPFDSRGLAIITRLNDSESSRRISSYLKDYSKITISTTGKDLKKLGIPEGPIYKKLLNRLLEVKLDGRLKNKGDEIAMLKKMTRGK